MDDGRDRDDVLVRQRLSFVEGRRRERLLAREHAVPHQRMEMEVQVQRATQALREHDGARSATSDACARGALAQPSEQRAHEDAADRRTQLRVEGQEVADSKGEREHPLPDRDVRQHVVAQVRGGVGHAPSAARRAEAAPLAREGDQLVLAATRAVHAREAEGQDAAVEVAAELAPDEAREPGAAALLGAREEGREMLAQDAVQDARLWLTALPRAVCPSLPGCHPRAQTARKLDRLPSDRRSARGPEYRRAVNRRIQSLQHGRGRANLGKARHGGDWNRRGSSQIASAGAPSTMD